MAEQADVSDEDFTAESAALSYFLAITTCSFFFFRERREHKIFEALLKGVPGLEERLITGSEDEVAVVAELVGSLFNTCFSLIADLVIRGSQRCVRRQGR
jgi:hypothetical protein